ncbi:LytR/AlgR family response regulator transcription factor [Salmonirosea aquatica]|uniref:Response regulator n=1 Tax=Salmonirosea aquatica TaxID=2654236 RepID=A0A7C9FER1_9BACT|nr:response regulator [Cytophagaceae bacterium SJW1-29]
MLCCVVLDDEPLAREVLEGYLALLDYIGSVIPFGSTAEALTYLKDHEVDVLFLDIEMPAMNGLDFLRSLENPPVTVFTTAYRNYAFEGFELGVIDFLLKPIAYPRFVQAIEKIRDFYSLREQSADLEANPPDDQAETIIVKSGVQRIRLDLADVLYIQGLKDYALIYTTTSKIVLKGSIKTMYALFPPPQFLRIHKSFIVAVPRVTRLERNRLLMDGLAIPLGRSYRADAERVLLNVR